MYPDPEIAVAAVLCSVLVVATVTVLTLLRRHKRDQEIRAMVSGWMAEYRESRKHLVECPHCLYGKTWRPELLAGTYSFDSEEPMLTDCTACTGEGFLPKQRLA